MKNLSKTLLGVSLLAVLVGCGGSGGGTTSSGTPAAIFVSDNLSTTFDHVWVAIKQVSFAKVGGGSPVVFNDPIGFVVDLRSLRDSQGRRFKFISEGNNLSGSYNSVTVTLADSAILFPTGAVTGQPRTFAGATGGNEVMSASFTPRTFAPGNDNFIVDFDLSTWSDNGTQVTGASIGSVSDNSGLGDLHRHNRDQYRGTVSNLTGAAPNQTFTLAQGGDSFTVQSNSSTKFFESRGGDATLENGERVTVRGAFDISSKTLLAQTIEVKDRDDIDSGTNEAFGSPEAMNATTGTFDLAVLDAGFLLSGDPVHVTTTSQTVYRDAAGLIVTQAQFFVDLNAKGVFVNAAGDYDGPTNTLVATNLKIDAIAGGD